MKYVAFDCYSYFHNTCSAQLLSIFDPIRSRFPNSNDRCGLTGIAEAELLLATAFQFWTEAVEKAIEIARSAPKAPVNTFPEGFSEYAYVKGERKLLHDIEFFTAALMQTCYVLGERLVAATDLLNKAQLDLIWPKVRQSPHSTGKRITERNLIKRFILAGGCAATRHARNINSLIQRRGHVTHTGDFQVHAEVGDMAMLRFTDAPYGSKSTNEFTSEQLAAEIASLIEFLKWWCSETYDGLTSLLTMHLLETEKGTARP